MGLVQKLHEVKNCCNPFKAKEFKKPVRIRPGPPEVILDSDVAERSRDNFKDSLINCIPVLLLMGLLW